jgi:hypothetical protein
VFLAVVLLHGRSRGGAHLPGAHHRRRPTTFNSRQNAPSEKPGCLGDDFVSQSVSRDRMRNAKGAFSETLRDVLLQLGFGLT